VLGRKCESKCGESKENHAIKTLKFRTFRIKLFECLTEYYVRQRRQVACKGHTIKKKKDYSRKPLRGRKIRKADAHKKGNC
jgi:hypothetical protein